MEELAQENQTVRFVKVYMCRCKHTGKRTSTSVKIPTCMSLQIEAENFPELSLKYEVVAVPTFIFLKVRAAGFSYTVNIVS